jgi:uncharacterized protein (UPF0332 family)
MRIEDIQSLISYRIQKAEESLKAAKIMLESNMLTFSMNRIYYSMFYAVQAVLALSGISFSKHGQVKAYLNRELIKQNILPLELGKIYNKAFEYRQKFDYMDFAIPDREMTDSYLEAAAKFLSAIKEYIQKELSRGSSI